MEGPQMAISTNIDSVTHIKYSPHYSVHPHRIAASKYSILLGDLAS
jgi:hypothetical protein